MPRGPRTSHIVGLNADGLGKPRNPKVWSVCNNLYSITTNQDAIRRCSGRLIAVSVTCLRCLQCFPTTRPPGGNKSAFGVLIWMDQDDDLERKIAGLTESVTADLWLGLALAGVNTLVVIGLYIVFK
jgi:hypothetical protein